jgi:hypothetical protein
VEFELRVESEEPSRTTITSFFLDDLDKSKSLRKLRRYGFEFWCKSKFEFGGSLPFSLRCGIPDYIGERRSTSMFTRRTWLLHALPVLGQLSEEPPMVLTVV